MRVIEARYEEGLLKPETPLPFTPGERIALIVVRHPDSRRWNLDRLAEGAAEDQTLAERGVRLGRCTGSGRPPLKRGEVW